VSESEPARRVTRVAAYGICLEDDRLLLCRLAPGELAAGQWTLPGGGLDFGEAPPDAVLRELGEETGLSGEIIGLADVLSWSRRSMQVGDGVDGEFHAIQIVYRVRVTGGALRDEPDGSTDAARWFSRGELDALPLVDLAREGVRLAFR
jgi:8-oxo-dGTP diphosphatase